MTTPHTFTLRVYYEDTDLAGIVYYANYLKFIERARSEWVRGLGVDQVQLRAQQGLNFAVRRVEADYLRPARFDDELRVETVLKSVSGARIGLVQDIFRGAEKVYSAQVVLVCLPDRATSGLPSRIPADLQSRLEPVLP